jgi:hypothetical protein
MFIAFSFVGILPNYTIDSIYQIRLFTDMPIYLIYNDYNSPYLNDITKYNVNLVKYDDVFSDIFNNTLNIYRNKFVIVDSLNERKELFIRSLERFFLLNNLLLKYNLSDCFFMEIDNLIYDDPSNWFTQFTKNNLCYMYDSIDRCSSGIMYVKNNKVLSPLCDYIIKYIKINNPGHKMTSEMYALANYYKSNHDTNIQILPTFWGNYDNMFKETYENYELYNDTIFDAAAIGMYLFGWDPIHTNGVIVKYKKSMCSLLECSNYKFKWELDDQNRNIPYIFNGTKWLRINNLHIHSKDLKSALSISK